MGGNKITLPWKPQQNDHRVLPTTDYWFSCCFYWHEASYKSSDLDQLQRGPYLYVPSCPTANMENPVILPLWDHLAYSR